MADEQKSLTDVAKNTGELLQEAGTKTTQTVLAHTEKYHDAYTTIDKIVDSF
ncbi:mechanosensitive ion channel family protein, partial [Acinetobacter baumannii]